MKDNKHWYQDFCEALLHCKSGSEEEFQIYKKMVEFLESEAEISDLEDDLSTDVISGINCQFSDDGIIYDNPCSLDDYAAPFDNLACIYMSRGEYEKAIELFQKVLPLYRTLEINNKDYTYQRYYAMQKLVECLCNIGNNELALYYKFELKYLKRYVIDLPKLHRIKQLLLDLKERNITPFIGYGNPNAEILIVGKECTHQVGDEGYKKFYEPNFNHWYETVFCGHECNYKSGLEPYTFEAGNFHPIYPYYKLINKMQSKNKEIGRPGPTHYYYQRLVEKIRSYANEEIVKSDYIDFFKDCFITEMCEICRPNDNGLTKEQHKEIESNIRERLDWMRDTNFFNQFKVVILACGPYAEAIKKDEVLRTDLFGDAYVVYCNQLSRWDKSLEIKIPDIQKVLYG